MQAENAGVVLGYMLTWALVGFLQWWLVLRPQLDGGIWWALASAVAFGIVGGVSTSLANEDNPAVFGAMFGLVFGIITGIGMLALLQLTGTQGNSVS